MANPETANGSRKFEVCLTTSVVSCWPSIAIDLGMPQQIRPQIESALYLPIDCLDLAGHRAGQHREAFRAAKVMHLRGKQTVGESIFLATIGPTNGVMTISHRSATAGTFEQYFDLVSIERNFGGRAWFFLCPVTGKRARKLYLWPEHGRFCHRLAASTPPTYASQRVGGVNRVMRSIWAIRSRLNADGGLLSSFEKPNWMPQKQFIAYSCRYLRLAGRLDFTTKGFRLRKQGHGDRGCPSFPILGLETEIRSR